MKLTPLDLFLVVAALASFALLGAWLRPRQTLEPTAFWLAGRRSPWWLLLASIVATETSTVTFLSIPGLAFGGNLGWLQLAAGFVLGRYLVAAWLLPGYFEGKIFTAYELLRSRFGARSERIASLLFVGTRTVADGLRLYLTALVLQELLGWPIGIAAPVVGLVTVAYTSAGGLKAVLWADLAQLALYLGGAALAFGVLLSKLPAGGFRVFETGGGEGFPLLDFRFSWSEPFNLWAGLVGGAFLTLASHGVDQMMVQRYLAAANPAVARRALVGSGWFVFFQFAFFLALGVALRAFYDAHPPAIAFERNDRVLVRFVAEELPPGATGLLLGAILAAAMSTLSSSLHSCATTWHRDLLRPRRQGIAPSIPEPDHAPPGTLTPRLTVAAFAVAQVLVAQLASHATQSVVTAVLGVASLSGGPMLGLFLLARIRPAARDRHAAVALAGGIAAVLAAFAWTPLAWTWYAALGCSVTLGTGMLLARRVRGSGFVTS